MRWHKDIDPKKLSRIVSVSLTKSLLVISSNLKDSDKKTANDVIRKELGDVLRIDNASAPIVMAQIIDVDSMSTLACFGFSTRERINSRRDIDFNFRLSLE